MDLQHGCRAEYGPLELRIQITDRLNGFMVYVEDPRLEQRCVYEQAVQSTLRVRKRLSSLEGQEYLNSYQEAAQHDTDWRCS